MVHPAAHTDVGTLAYDCLDRWDRDLNDFDAVLIGPGMTTHDQSRLLVESVLADSRIPLIVDADALNVCEGRRDMLRRASCPVVITPHPGEMARLFGYSSADIQANRFGAARRAVGALDAVVVLKGAGTLVAAKDKPLNINMTGNPGMATGGMGDVLSGVIAGLAAQRMDPFDAARIGVYLHGRAGDNAALRGSQAALAATDLIVELPHVFREISAR
jgi:NAD(P)H-hydrate epimerase